jgi:hypothetical protein
MNTGNPLNEYVIVGELKPGSGFVDTVTFCGEPPRVRVTGFGVAVAVKLGVLTTSVTVAVPAPFVLSRSVTGYVPGGVAAPTEKENDVDADVAPAAAVYDTGDGTVVVPTGNPAAVNVPVPPIDAPANVSDNAIDCVVRAGKAETLPGVAVTAARAAAP